MPTRKEEEHGNRIDRSHLHARSLLRTDSSDVVSDIRRTDGDQERVAHSQREAEISNTEGGSNAGVTHVGVPDGYRDRDIAGGEHHRAGVAHTQEIGETDGPDTQYNRDSRGSHPRPDTLLAVPGGGDLHHDTHHQGYLQGAQRGVEAAPKTPEQPHAVQNQFTAPANMVGETSPPVREMRKRTANKKVPTPEELALQERCRGMQATINEWRGYGLTKQGAIINEHKCVRALCEQYTDEQIRRIRYYLFSHHWRWSKPDNRYTIGACTILEEAGNVTQILKNGTAPAKKTYQEEELVEWQGRMMTEEEANKLGFNGGFGAYL